MDKRLILAVAGSGKSTLILNDLSPHSRSLILTYTNQNLFSLSKSIRERNGGVIPENIEVSTYFSFLYSFCIRPYLSYKLRDNGFVYGALPTEVLKIPRSNISHYMTKGRYLYAPRAAKLLRDRNLTGQVLDRLSTHFDKLYIDEVQDFAGNDFNFILELSQARIDTLFTGDYFQHTYDTSRDGNTRSSLHKKGVAAYSLEFEKAGFRVDSQLLSRSHRCSPTVCEYISSELGIEISSHRSEPTEVERIDSAELEQSIFDDPSVVKLFYNNSREYDCFSNNWGNSKGLNSYHDVCVVLNKKTAQMLSIGKGRDIPEATKNKLYVACSRARGNLYLVDGDRIGRFLRKRPR